ncbi:MAG: prepilin-type N-terminal cleavage/methylation domain-containing protein [Candidatus Omnitrophica bacterium]|nr:prepilin-type N-terminal cleavage/methylation domain-containing protein [Candidatus Omnitrophota bacterium]MCB9747462.1 prepilin-type N-terminal cleavage/methylation domain-containing protein [Candidatus Omnitrophota bacterium]
MNKDNDGFTLVELLIVAGIMSVVLTGMIKLFIYTNIQAELAGNKTMAVNEAQMKLEEIRNHTYAQIVADYGSGGTPGNTFNLNQLNGMGVIYVDSTNTELLEVDIKVCWQDKYNRIIGEDLDLDGVLDVGEDNNSNGQIDSIVSLSSMITRR